MSPNRLFDYIPPARRVLAIPQLALSTVMSKDGRRIYASSDRMFRGAVFARDSLEVAEDLMDTKPKVVENVLISMVELQGTATDDVNEEEVGKVVHEYRAVVVDGKRLDSVSLNIFYELARRFGGDEKEMAYYGSVDATPLFLRVLGRFYRQYGQDILSQKVKQRDGKAVTVKAAAGKAARWLADKLDGSRSGLLEWQRTNPHGWISQAWKDSEEFYVHESGEFANHEAPISSIEVQGLAYDALHAAVNFFPQDAGRYQALADKLRDRVFELLWQPERQYFALGTDYDKEGNLRVMHTKTANPAELLDTTLFDDLTEDEKKQYVGGIVKTIMSKDFLTSAGIRSRALSASELVDFWDYHGSFVTWPKETHDIAKGLHRQGFPELAKQLENRLLNIVLRTYDYPEFVYVDEWGRVMAGSPAAKTHGELIDVHGVDKPERMQAWTISAIWHILAHRKSSRKAGNRPVRTWQAGLEKEIMSKIPKINRFINPLRLLQYYPTHQYHLPRMKAKYK